MLTDAVFIEDIMQRFEKLEPSGGIATIAAKVASPL